MSVGAIVLSDVVATVLPAALVVWLLRHRRDYVPRSDLTRHGNVIVQGVVEAEQAPITIEYDQRRYEMGASSAARMDGKTVYDWNEEARRIKAKPFVLRTTDMRIQVEPDEDDVSLLWYPDHKETKRERHRILRAILEPGTTVEIFGELRPAAATHAPYREASPLPTLVPSRVERLLVSKKPLAPTFAKIRTYLRARAIVVAAAAGIAHIAVDPVLRADLAPFGGALPPGPVRTAIGIALGVIALYFWRTKRPWIDGRLSERVAQ